MNKVPKRKTVCYLHDCLKHILRLCRWSGHFLVENVSDHRTMKFLNLLRISMSILIELFNMKSLYMLYFSISFLLLFQNMLVNLKKLIEQEDNDLNHLGNLMLGSSGIIKTVLLYRFAKHWPSLVQFAIDTEKRIAHMIRISSRVHIKCAALSYAVILSSFVEHFLYTNFKLQHEVYCSDVQLTAKEGFDNFLRNHYANFFDYLPFYEWIAIFAQLTRIQANFIWNVSDILGMCFSVYLTAYFQKLGTIIHSKKQKNWSAIRECYSRLAILLNRINKQLAPFILLSAFYNLFFMCKQLYGSITYIFGRSLTSKICDKGFELEYLVQSYLLYYVFSFVYLAVRCLGFAYLATNVHTSAYNAVLPLYEVPSTEYTHEVECFQLQLRFNKAGLDGVFFFVERQTILRVIATIITYELVLLQFAKLQRSPFIDGNIRNILNSGNITSNMINLKSE